MSLRLRSLRGNAKGLMLVAFACMLSSAAFAQAAPAPPRSTPTSPEVLADRRVVFRLYAPKADEVRLFSEGPEASPGMTEAELAKAMAGTPMTESPEGVWSVTFGPIEPGVYRYTFRVDGVTMPDPRNLVHSETMTNLASILQIPGDPMIEYRTEVPHGAMSSVWYPAAMTVGVRRMHIYTPPGYEHNNKSYPVLYLLGGGNTDDVWDSIGRAGAIMDNLIFAGKAEPMIVVMPCVYAVGGLEVQVSSNTHRDVSDPELIKGVLPFVDSHYRVIPDRQHRAIAGLSFGGLQALDTALIHSDLFANAGIWSSGWYEALSEERERTTRTYKTQGKPFTVFMLAAGKRDFANRGTETTAETLRQAGIRPVITYTEGFHAWNTFREDLALFAPKIFRPVSSAR